MEGALELGYTLGEQYRDQGYAVEACGAVLAYAFDELEQPGGGRGTRADQPAQPPGVQKAGLYLRGHGAPRAARCPAGGYADEIRYSLLREEYRPAPK